MPESWLIVGILYGAGVLVGLAGTDAPAASRLGLALAWPLGPAAFVLTVATLLVAASITFPAFGALLAAAAAASWWTLT